MADGQYVDQGYVAPGYFQDGEGVSRVADDSAGGNIIGVLAPTVFVNGKNIAVVGASIANHGTGLHSSPTMTEGSSTVFANGVPVCRSGDASSCGHVASGSDNVFAG